MTEHVSVILSCSSVASQVRRFLDELASDSPERIELLLVAWEDLDYRPLAEGRFRSVRRVAFPRGEPLNVARARAVREATGRVVVFVEDHVRFDGPWLETLARLFAREPAPAAAGWVVEVGRRESLVSWAGYLVEYGAWGPGTPTGRRDHLAGHNVAYLRRALEAVGPELPDLLRCEGILHGRLAAAGERLVLTPEIRMRHYQFLSLWRFLRADFWYGWNYADVRQMAWRWGAGRRTLQVLAAPLVPLVRWARLGRTLGEGVATAGLAARCAPAITLAFVAATLGESLGHVLGPRAAPLRLSEMELDYDRGLDGG